jgi:hypothetical protein
MLYKLTCIAHQERRKQVRTGHQLPLLATLVYITGMDDDMLTIKVLQGLLSRPQVVVLMSTNNELQELLSRHEVLVLMSTNNELQPIQPQQGLLIQLLVFGMMGIDHS